jgi:hypothetical protein
MHQVGEYTAGIGKDQEFGYNLFNILSYNLIISGVTW